MYKRSGTASLYQILLKLSSRDRNIETPHMKEYTGGSAHKSERFFQEDLRNENEFGHWVVKFICYEQDKHPNVGIVGFKWKPHESTLTENKARQGLELLGKLKEPHQIKVIRSRRNLLDVVISR